MRQNASTRAARQRADIRRARTRPIRHRRLAAAAAFQADRRPAATTTAHSRTAPTVPDPLLLGAATWLACGIVLLGLTPLPLHDAHLGWSFTFWALAAPVVVLLARCIRRRNSWIRDE